MGSLIAQSAVILLGILLAWLHGYMLGFKIGYTQMAKKAMTMMLDTLDEPMAEFRKQNTIAKEAERMRGQSMVSDDPNEVDHA